MKPLLKNLIIALSITVLLSGAYIMFGRSSSDIDSSLGGAAMNPELLVRSQEIFENTNRIDNYRMDTGILSDRRFTSLANTRVDLNAFDVGSGRTNPFAPVQ